MATAENAETDDPILQNLRRETELPRSEKATIDKSAPPLALANVDTDDPALANLRADIELPKTT